MTFKTQHPKDLVSRLFILEYMREIGADTLYARANEAQRKEFFYKFTSEDTNIPIEEVDVNWEYALFVATMPQLEYFIKNFMDEIEAIDNKREAFMRTASEQSGDVASINLRDLAVADVERTKAEMDANGYH